VSLRIPIDMIRPNPWNVNLLTEEEFNRLKEFMKSSGPERTPPAVVREREGGYEIVDGEQRWRAAKELGWRSLPAMVIKASDLEAKKYTLSFNYLKGRINYIKMLELMAEDEELAAAAREVFSKSEWAALENLLKLYREGRIAPRVLKAIEGELRRGARIDPKILEILDVPEEHQEVAAGMMLTAYHPKDLREILLRQYQPVVKEEARVEFKEPLEEERVPPEKFPLEDAGKIKGEAAKEGERAAAERIKLEEVESPIEEDVEETVKSIVAPAEAIVSFTCEKCKTKHAICYNRERKTIEVYRIKDVGGTIKSLRADTAFKIPFTTFACPRCGKRLGVDFEDRRVVELGENRGD